MNAAHLSIDELADAAERVSDAAALRITR